MMMVARKKYVSFMVLKNNVFAFCLLVHQILCIFFAFLCEKVHENVKYFIHFRS